MTASPANFSTMPPCVRDALRDVLEVGVDAAANDLGVARGDERGRADEIDEEDGCELAFHSVIVVDEGPVAAARARCFR